VCAETDVRIAATVETEGRTVRQPLSASGPRATGTLRLTRVAILPGNRCDEHARGQATAPFTLRIGDAPPGKVLIAPPPSGQAAATTVLDRACGPH
jgi:hypothetical protein